MKFSLTTFFVALLFTAPALSLQADSPSETPPNILFIFIDDLG